MITKSLAVLLAVFNSIFLAPVSTPDTAVVSGQTDILKTVAVYATEWNNPGFLPIRNWSVGEPPADIRAGVVFLTNSFDAFNFNSARILYQKDAEQPVPIASLTKIMTAVIAIENLNLEQMLAVSSKALAAYGERGGLKVGEQITAKDLFYALLLESSNDAAYVLAEATEGKTGAPFVDLMNQKAAQIGLKNTFFAEPSGVDAANISTPYDLAKLIKYSFQHPFLWEAMRAQNMGAWTNTNELLRRLPNLLGGKTGYTDEAQGCLMLVSQRREGEYLITVVLGAQDRFAEAEKLLNWTEEAYLWE